MVDSKIVELTFVLIPSLSAFVTAKTVHFFMGSPAGEKSWFRNKEIKNKEIKRRLWIDEPSLLATRNPYTTGGRPVVQSTTIV